MSSIQTDRLRKPQNLHKIPNPSKTNKILLANIQQSVIFASDQAGRADAQKYIHQEKTPSAQGRENFEKLLIK